MTRLDAMTLILEEAARAAMKHPAFHSAHEGFAVIYEEFDELKAEVWKRERDKAAMLEEAVQLGAMALRFITDVCGEVTPSASPAFWYPNASLDSPRAAWEHARHALYELERD